MTGILCLDKPEGLTSFVAADRVKRRTGAAKAGHCGTLDPMATGVLPVLLGSATRFLPFLPTAPKRYTAVLKLGVRTDTLDRTGTVLETRPVTVDRAAVLAALDAFRGDIRQVPPMYSAVKKDGVRMYDLARKGMEVPRDPRPVTIFRLELLDGAPELMNHPLAEQEYVLDVTCSGGTYIRTLIDDLGAALGCGAVMTDLRRTAVGPFSEESAVSWEELNSEGETNLSARILPVDRFLQQYPDVAVTDKQAARFRNGGELFLDRLRLPEHAAPVDGELLYRIYGPDGAFLGLGVPDEEAGLMKIRRIFTGR